MKRLAYVASALALLAAAAVVVSPAGAQGEKTPSIKEIMTKANKPNGLYFNLSKDLKDDELMWDEIQKEAKDLAKLAAALAKNEPVKGPKDSWAKLTKDYSDNAKGAGRSRSEEGPAGGADGPREARRHDLHELPQGAPPQVTPISGRTMLDGNSVAAALKECGVSHVVWIPDSELGTWEPALTAEPGLRLIRVCREGEAVAVAAGLHLGGRRPVVAIQCTGLFEAGDALRNVVHDLKLPLFFLIGLRGYYAQQQGATNDTCPVFTEPILRAWQLPYALLDRRHTAADLVAAYRQAEAEGRAGAVLIAE
jgi:sulfopyruvate decarboxylase subunit alpha